MRYDYTAIPDAEVPVGVEPAFRHTVTTYASETNKTVSVWEAVPDTLLDFKPHARVNAIRTILVHQILSGRRFFAQFVGLSEPAAESLLPPGAPGKAPTTAEYVDRAKSRVDRSFSVHAHLMIPLGRGRDRAEHESGGSESR